MKHKRFEEWLRLYLYEELSEQEKVLLENHLDDCGQCRAELDKLRRLHSTLTHRKRTEVKEAMLQDARRSLRLQILENKNKGSVFSKAKGLLDDLMSPSLQMAVGGVAILVVGVLLGYFVFSSPNGILRTFQSASSMSAVEAGESQVMNVRFIERDPQSGNVEFAFETITPVHVRGNVNDEQVQKLLAHALISDQNAGTRLRAVNMIGSHSQQNQNHSAGMNAEVKTSLVKALLNDRNLGVRKEALDVLRKYLPDPVIVRAFLNVLANEKNTGLKIAAINSLDLTKYENQPLNSEIVEMFKQKAQSDENNYIRIKAKAALQEVQQ